MKTIDFTQPGGFPLTQDQLGYLQGAFAEALGALAAQGGSGPLVINGVAITKTAGIGGTFNYAYTDGWVLYNGQLHRVPAGSLMNIDETVNNAYFLVTTSGTSLVFNDGSTPNVILDTTAAMVAQAIGTADDATHFAISNLQAYGREATFTQIVVSTSVPNGSVSGWIYYRKNNLNNTLHLKFFLGMSNAQVFAAPPDTSPILLATLPVGYRPTDNNVNFSIPVQGRGGTQSRILDYTGVGYVDHVRILIDLAGGITAYFIKPDAAIPNYAFIWSGIVPLD